PIRLRVIGPADIHLARPPLAEMGEIDAARRVDDEIVRSLERHVAAGAVDGFDGAGLEVDALEPAAAVILGLRQRPDAALFAMPFEAAIVRDIAFAVRPDRGAVWAAAGCRDDALRAVRRNARQLDGCDLDQHIRSVCG